MSTKNNFLGLLICELFALTSQSITGVTYKDHFDFEERYSHDECNPLYWHPLHMPDHCTKLYEQLIRTRLYNTHPYNRKQLEKDEKSIKQLKRIIGYRPHRRKYAKSSDVSNNKSQYSDSRSSSECESSDSSKSCEFTGSSSSSSENNEESRDTNEVHFNYITQHTNPKNGPPYQQMLSMIRQDAMYLPAAPIVGVLPPIGLAAIYRQPVSTKTKKTIEKMASAYASAAQESYMENAANLFPYLYPPYPPQEPPPQINATVIINNVNNSKNTNNKRIELNKQSENKVKIEIKKLMQPYEEQFRSNKAGTELDRKKDKIQTKKIVNGNTVTYIQNRNFIG